MRDTDWLAQRFQEHRAHLQNVAHRILGSQTDAEDALQEAWIRLTQSRVEQIENLGGWLTTVVSRICLDMLRSRKLREGESLDEDLPTPDDEPGNDPEGDILLADSLGPALLVVLEQLTPAERVAFVLHDLFGLPFEEIASIVGRSEMATRQLASRARRRIRGVKGSTEDEKVKRQVVSAFLAASREGDFEALLRLLDPEIVLEADETSVRASAKNAAKGAPQYQRTMRGAKTIAELFRGKATAVRLALIDDSVGGAFVLNQIPMAVFTFTVRSGRISYIGITMNREDMKKVKVKIIESTDASAERREAAKGK